MLVLVTREAAFARRTAAALAAAGHVALCEPLTRTVPLPHAPLPEGLDAILLTSPAAAAVFAGEAGAHLGTPVFAVGERTAAAARDAGFAVVHAASGDGAALSALVLARLPAGARLAYPSAARIAGDLPGALSVAGYDLVRRVVYRTEAVEGLGEATREALRGGRIDAVLHFSAAAARAYFRLAAQAGLSAEAETPRQLCLSDRIAAAVRGNAIAAIVAEKPNEQALIALVSPRCPQARHEARPPV